MVGLSGSTGAGGPHHRKVGEGHANWSCRQRVAVVATLCADCGSVKVNWNGVFQKSVPLTVSTTKRKQVVELLAFASPTSGTLNARSGDHRQGRPHRGARCVEVGRVTSTPERDHDP